MDSAQAKIGRNAAKDQARDKEPNLVIRFATSSDPGGKTAKKITSPNQAQSHGTLLDANSNDLVQEDADAPTTVHDIFLAIATIITRIR